MFCGPEGLRPSHYVGAEIPILGTNAHWDTAGEYFVAEGDESDGTVALFQPEHTIILNIEEEHLDYYADLAAIEAGVRAPDGTHHRQAFSTASTIRTRNASATGATDTVSFGASCRADYRFGNPRAHGISSPPLKCIGAANSLGTATLNVPGVHNISNATSVIALASELGVDFATIAARAGIFSRRAAAFRVQTPQPALRGGR